MRTAAWLKMPAEVRAAGEEKQYQRRKTRTLAPMDEATRAIEKRYRLALQAEQARQDGLPLPEQRFERTRWLFGRCVAVRRYCLLGFCRMYPSALTGESRRRDPSRRIRAKGSERR